ncbi:MAG: flagellar hook-associated protein FlgK [Sulfobacillus benefaciens]|uniref:Flagellar hook-associated protein 1 n=1 Tax=Sulfobacillus benefaciens TaxID=453960 RepID=A0A2T2XGT6_9FIRM|nr:MAG: flagellar hook-associated protein FlgK [Sulfobacillus benefaciens]
MSFMMLNIAARALAAQQLALDVTGNNMANATTPGYQAETANLTEAPPQPIVALQNSELGTGVVVSSISRASNPFLSRSVRTQLGNQGYWSSINQALSQIQSLFQEPSPSGLQEGLNQFFASWQTLSNDPENQASQEQVIEQGKNIASQFNTMATSITGEMQNLAHTAQNQISQINTLSQQIAQLNTQIASVTSSGGTANDLLDQRGQLLDNLSALTNVSYTVSANQEVNVYLGSNALVVNGDSYSLALTQATQAPVNYPTNAPLPYAVTWLGSPTAPGVPLTGLTSGQLLGTLSVLNTSLPSYLNQLNTLAYTFANAVNSQSPTTFFTPLTSAEQSSAATMLSVVSTLTPGSLEDATNPGNGSAALAVSQLGTVIDPQYTTLVGQVGVDGQNALNQSNTANTTLTSLQNALQSATGVDLNQQSATLIQEQQSYTAAATMVSVEQSTMQSLLQAVG